MKQVIFFLTPSTAVKAQMSSEDLVVVLTVEVVSIGELVGCCFAVVFESTENKSKYILYNNREFFT
jgi:type III secretory pathway component EscT